jgi:putative ABC transport system permease protein
MQMRLDFMFSLSGLVIWLLAVLALAALASFLPAWNASRITVRDVLAYE